MVGVPPVAAPPVAFAVAPPVWVAAVLSSLSELQDPRTLTRISTDVAAPVVDRIDTR
jgi:hypothetical protein